MLKNTISHKNTPDKSPIHTYLDFVMLDQNANTFPILHIFIMKLMIWAEEGFKTAKLFQMVPYNVSLIHMWKCKLELLEDSVQNTEAP